jgi:hypothetical protein
VSGWSWQFGNFEENEEKPIVVIFKMPSLHIK